MAECILQASYIFFFKVIINPLVFVKLFDVNYLRKMPLSCLLYC
jgi:hypothetical protein